MSNMNESGSHAAGSAAVAVENVSKIYPGGVEALNNMTLQFSPGKLKRHVIERFNAPGIDFGNIFNRNSGGTRCVRT